MPIVNIKMIEGRSVETKRKMVEAVTREICRTLEITPERVRIVIEDVSKDNLAVGGKLMSDSDS